MEYLCPWESASYFGLYSSNVPALLYYSHVPALLGALFLGIFIFSHAKKNLATYSMLGISIFFAFWNLFDLFLWATNRADITIFFWSLQVLLEILVFILAFCFVYAYQKKKSLPHTLTMLIALPVLALALLTPTHFNLIGVNLSDCTAIENTVAKYLSYLIEAVVIIAIALLSMEQYRKTTDRKKRKETALVGIGTILFLMMFVYGNLIGSFLDDWEIAQYGLFGMIVFMAFIVYLIVRFKTFNIKVLATQALVWTLWLLIGSELFFVSSIRNRFLVMVTLLMAVIFGIFLVRSVKREVKQRERLEVLSKELAAANVKLKELDKLKDEFLSFASHDLKSPVAKMKQWASLIYDKTYSTPAQIEETAFKIQTTADRAVRLVDEFLNIRKIEEGRMEYNFEPKDVVGFVSGITSDFIPIAKQKGLELTFSSDAHAISVKIDTIKMRQVFENIIDNSIKYTTGADERGLERGQTPTERSGHGFIKVGVTEEQKSVLISVKDSGAGIEPAIIATLFSQFRRDPTTAKLIKGTGLGLYIAKQIVVAHKGEIWAESDGINKGSAFFVRLPKA